MGSAINSDKLTKIRERLRDIKATVDGHLFYAISYVSNPIDRVAEYITRVSATYWRLSFFSLVLLYTAALLVQAWSYSSDARLFPLLIGIPLIFMIILYIGLTISSRYDDQSGGIFDDFTEEALSEAEKDEPINSEKKTQIRLQREFKMVLWIVSTLFLTYYVGFLNALAVFLFAFIYIHEKKLIRASIVTVVTLAFIQVLFIEILALPLWEGALFSSIIAVPKGWEEYNE